MHCDNIIMIIKILDLSSTFKILFVLAARHQKCFKTKIGKQTNHIMRQCQGTTQINTS